MFLEKVMVLLRIIIFVIIFFAFFPITVPITLGLFLAYSYFLIYDRTGWAKRRNCK